MIKEVKEKVKWLLIGAATASLIFWGSYAGIRFIDSKKRIMDCISSTDALKRYLESNGINVVEIKEF